MQKIFPEAVQFSLEKGLQPFYLLTGNDLLLVNEAKDSINQTARLNGFDEKQEIDVKNDTNWEELFESAQSMGLFFARQIIILNLPDSPTTAQFKNLAELLALSHSDLLFVLHLPKFTKAVEKQAWFNQIEPQLVQINCQTPEISKLPQWLNNRAKAMQLQIEPEANQLLCYSYEGNLLALKQALQLLQLRFTDGNITLTRAKEVVEHSAQFTPFQWIDALFEGKTARAIRILHHLKNEDVQAVVLLRIVQKELVTLLEITRSPTSLLSSNQPLFIGNLRTEFDRLKIWQNRRPFYSQVVQRLSYKKLYALIQQLAELERKIKQEFSDDVWQELERFSANFA
ncbi:DNA polymerase III subunit delta [Mannheimia sp. AT1]|uniref:DNA polymerase III subunit delta n=1 Tax=Mannheimia cairinae TaxID=3025936 RepID=A0ABT5MNJ2_9PAST|nr:DNA polymerase III subunit delta [Mannheimia cairinae]MDD0823056.1 DNA polymerase III subunit delta [Mannheimia cairinae]MDD0825919.1 DNA polymerase III subunit delta [Mannheimia cairinae]